MEGGDVSGHPWLVLWHPECVLQEMAEVPDAATYHGRDGVVTFMQRLSELFDGFRFTPVEIIEGSDGVFVAVDNWGKSKAGVELQVRVFQVLRVRDGMVVFATGYSDRNEALKAVGLAE
jgi:ketosteroid isomerase-like protein